MLFDSPCATSPLTSNVLYLTLQRRRERPLPSSQTPTPALGPAAMKRQRRRKRRKKRAKSTRKRKRKNTRKIIPGDNESYLNRRCRNYVRSLPKLCQVAPVTMSCHSVFSYSTDIDWFLDRWIFVLFEHMNGTLICKTFYLWKKWRKLIFILLLMCPMTYASYDLCLLWHAWKQLLSIDLRHRLCRFMITWSNCQGHGFPVAC